MSPRPYLDSARIYELAYYYSRARDDEFLRFLGEVLAEHSPGLRVLDCACGTGEPSLQLPPEFALTLADSSPSMLRLARSKAKAMGRQGVSFRLSTWQDLQRRLRTQFDTVLCCGNSFPQLAGARCRLAALAGMAAVLRLGGLLYLDFEEHSPAPRSKGFAATELGGPVVWRGQRYFLIHFHKSNGEVFRRRKVCYRLDGFTVAKAGEVTTTYHRLDQSELFSALKGLGFTRISALRRPGRWPMTAVIAQKDAR